MSLRVIITNKKAASNVQLQKTTDYYPYSVYCLLTYHEPPRHTPALSLYRTRFMLMLVAYYFLNQPLLVHVLVSNQSLVSYQQLNIVIDQASSCSSYAVSLLLLLVQLPLLFTDDSSPTLMTKMISPETNDSLTIAVYKRLFSSNKNKPLLDIH